MTAIVVAANWDKFHVLLSPANKFSHIPKIIYCYNQIMNFKEIQFAGTPDKSYIPDDINLKLPENNKLPTDQLHFLLYIPWEEKYINFVPQEFRNLFNKVLPYLHFRTTDVHTAISLGFLDEFIGKFPNTSINRTVVAVSLILHDSGWSKMSEEEIADSLGVKGLVLTEKAVGPKEKHAAESVKIAKEVLGSDDYGLKLTQNEMDLIYNAVLFHDKPEMVTEASGSIPIEVKLLVDLDHFWSFTHENFWQDTIRKGVLPKMYLQNLSKDLDKYFVTDEGKKMAANLLAQRVEEVSELKNI